MKSFLLLLALVTACGCAAQSCPPPRTTLEYITTIPYSESGPLNKPVIVTPDTTDHCACMDRNRTTGYTLITVTQGGMLAHDHYETELMCKQAKSLALTGMTLEQVDEQNKQEAKRHEEDRTREKARLEALRAQHPPAPPSAAERAEFKRDGYVLKKGLFYSIGDDGLLHLEPAAIGSFATITSWGRAIGPGDITRAECIPEGR